MAACELARSGPAKGSGGLTFLLAFSVPVLVLEAATRAVKASAGGWLPGVHSYLWEVRYAGDLMRSIFEPAVSTLWFNAIHLLRTEGPLYAGLLAVALAASARGGCRAASRRGVLLVALSVVSLLDLYSIPSFRTSRTLLAVFVHSASDRGLAPVSFRSVGMLAGPPRSRPTG